VAADEPVKIEAEIPDRVWELYFSPQGVIPRLEKTMNKLCQKLDAVATGLDQTRRDMVKYNELRPEIQKWAEAQTKHQKYCESVQTKKAAVESTNANWEERIEAERIKARDEAWNRSRVIIGIVGLVLAGLGFILGQVWPMFF
jgi:ferric-dicitrate binding protein FerR (iron transport regulator)